LLKNRTYSSYILQGKSSLANTPQKYKETPLWRMARENTTSRTSLTGLSVLLRNAIVIIYSRGVLQPSGIRGFGNGVSQLSRCLHFDLSLAMAIHSSKSFEMPLLLSAFSNVLPKVIRGQPIGRECDTQPVSNCRGVRLMGMRATWPAQRRIRV
jgi:hypothetical protein